MQTLSKDPMMEVIYKMDVSDFSHFCQTNSEMSKWCQNEEVWKMLFERDFTRYFSKVQLKKGQTWKNLYEEQYHSQKLVRKQFPFWYEHRHDPQLQDMYALGWMSLYNQLQNLPASFNLPTVESLYEAALLLDPNVQFANDHGTVFKRINKVNKGSQRSVYLLFSPSISNEALGGLTSLFMTQGIRISAHVVLRDEKGTLVQFGQI